MDYSPLVSLNKALLGPAISWGGGGVALAVGTLASHENMEEYHGTPLIHVWIQIIVFQNLLFSETSYRRSGPHQTQHVRPHTHTQNAPKPKRWGPFDSFWKHIMFRFQLFDGKMRGFIFIRHKG